MQGYVSSSHGLGGTRRVTNWNDSLKLEEQTRRHSPPEPVLKYGRVGVGIIKAKLPNWRH